MMNETGHLKAGVDTRVRFEMPQQSFKERTPAQRKHFMEKRTPPRDEAACGKIQRTENYLNSTNAKKLGCRRGTQVPKLTGRMCTQARADSRKSSGIRILRRRRGRSRGVGRGCSRSIRRRGAAAYTFNAGLLLHTTQTQIHQNSIRLIRSFC